MLPQPILVSDEQIKEGDFYFKYDRILQWVKETSVTYTRVHPSNYPKPIVAGLPDLPKLDLSLIAEEIGWVDVEKLALKEYPKDLHRWAENQFDDFNESDRNTWINGFKAAQSLNEKKYSDEDLFNLLKMVHDKRLDSLSARIVDNGRVTDFNFWNSYSKKQVYASELISEFIQSLPKLKEFLVEVQMEVNQCDGCISGHHIIDGIHKAPYPSGSMVCKKHLYDRPKITNNTIKVIKILH